jgi:hypothetical protein
MRLLSDYESNQGQPHANKDDFAVFDLARRGRDHEFVEGVLHFEYLALSN